MSGAPFPAYHVDKAPVPRQPSQHFQCVLWLRPGSLKKSFAVQRFRTVTTSTSSYWIDPAGNLLKDAQQRLNLPPVSHCLPTGWFAGCFAACWG